MTQLKQIFMGLHGENKEKLNKIYTDRQVYIASLSSSNQPVEDERIFHYKTLSFCFSGTGLRMRERMIMEIHIPLYYFPDHWKQTLYQDTAIIWEDFLLRSIGPHIKAYTEENQNDKKDEREKAKFYVQDTSDIILKRNGIHYDPQNQSFIFKLIFIMPLINGYTVNGSILPGTNPENKPLKNIVPFESPESLRKKIIFEDGSSMEGMAIPMGITVIIGGGYQGKSTLLNALEMGIYHYLPGNGREYVITDTSGIKIYAEDGRPVNNLDLSPFFMDMHDLDFKHFSTNHASGSVSQAANIIEAVYSKSNLLLIDEDTSATNFMIRDQKMREIVKHEPIIPFTDRVRQLYEDQQVSTILVIGGSSEYLNCADRILLVDQYKFSDITKTIHASAKKEPAFPQVYQKNCWLSRRTLKTVIMKSFTPKCINVEHAKYIHIDQYYADITKITTIQTNAQQNFLARLLAKLLSEEDETILNMDLNDRIDILMKQFLEQSFQNLSIPSGHTLEPWYHAAWLEEIRPMDLFSALCRIRGVEFV